jgi:ribosomal protein S27E
MPQAPRSDFITLSCPNCGGKLSITSDTERFACQFCGHEHIVRRSGGIISLEPVMRMMGQINENINLVGSGINRISGSAEKQASEAAINRIKQEIAEHQAQIANLNSGFGWGWALIIFGAVSTMGFFLASNGVCYKLCRYAGWFFAVLTVIFIILVISMIGSQNKAIADQKKIIQTLESEMARHYQVVSQFGNR